MRKIIEVYFPARVCNLLWITLLLVIPNIQAQAPEGFSYKGIAYNNGSPVTGQTVALRCSIRETSASGTVIYTEIHTVLTNINGVYSVVIGSNNPTAFAAINWWPLQKFLQIELDPAGGTNFTQNIVTPMTSVPYALYSKTTTSIGEVPGFVDNITALRAIAGTVDGQVVGVKGYNVPGDGGGGFFKWHIETPYKYALGVSGHYYLDNGGTLIKGANSTAGVWVRQYDGMLNIAYFGALGIPGVNYTAAIQNAINYSEQLTRYGPPNGNTVYIPNGTYAVTQLTMKMGVSIKGESMEKTMIVPFNNTAGYLIVTEPGRVRFNMSDINLKGISTHFTGNSIKGAINFSAIYKEEDQFDWGDYGSIEYTALRNIKISNFQGHGILMEGGTRDDYDTPIQFNIFENVKITKGSLLSTSNALRIISQNGQNTFINCQFEGGIGSACSSGDLVYMAGEHPGYKVLGVDVLTFQNCAFQNADQGIRMNYVESVTVDNCFFSRLGESISMASSIQGCRSVNILNNRFSNAAGYGSLTGSSGFVKQNNFCIRSEGSAYTASGNYIVEGSLCSTCGFCYTEQNNLSNVTSANTFYQNGDYGSVGVTKNSIQSSGTPQFPATLQADYHRVIYLDGSAFSSINSFVAVGDTITIIASASTYFSNSGNINFPGSSMLILGAGEAAVFRKTDEGNVASYQLVSLVKNNP
ncbi:MAG TPA: glycosyl hydrolase family 28-related protein [Flavobacterium sp.]|jgi:hypothetical protein